MKTTTPTTSLQRAGPDQMINRRWVFLLIATLALGFLLGTTGFQTYWSKERRLIAAADEIVTALKAYRDASPGTAKEFPLELADLMRDPRTLADKSYIATLPIDPITQKQEWGVLRNASNQVIGVHSLSTESPTLFARLLSFRGGEAYSDWEFSAE
jgi:hypothetical protein